MPVKKRREKSRALDQWCKDELLNGPCLLAGCGYFDYDAARLIPPPSMARDWARHRESLLAEWKRENPGTRPYGWWEWDAPEPLPEWETQRDYLARHDLLTDED